MSILGFSAEVSLYKTSEYYQTGRDGMISSRRKSTAIYPCEVIEVHDVAPPDPWGWGPGGWQPLGGGGGGGGGPISTDPGDGGKGAGGGNGRPTLQEARMKTLGQGPNRKDLTENWKCEPVGLGFVECRLCNGKGKTYGCACLYCENRSGACTLPWDCTNSHG